MARLFITQRELNFISDITKELIKDVSGQKIYYYPISELKSNKHELYGEAIEKVYDNPIIIDALVSNEFQVETVIGRFGVDAQYKVEVFLQYRDLVEKGINVCIGDMFSYGDVFYEITERIFLRNIYGQVEHKDGLKLIGIKARDSQFKTKIKGPTDISYTDPDAVQIEFKQQRGKEVIDGEQTGDVRDLVKNGVLEEPLTGPKEVSHKGDPDNVGSSFYGDEE